MSALAGTRFPWATLTINVSGAFVLGLLATVMGRLDGNHPARLFALVGFLGGYTTFSTFALESHELAESGAAGRSLAYMAGSVAAGLLAVTLGVALGRALGYRDGPYPQRPPGIAAGGGDRRGGVGRGRLSLPGLGLERGDHRRRADRREQVGLRLGGLPESVEPRVLHLDEPKPALLELRDVGLLDVEELLQGRDLPPHGVGHARGEADQADGTVPLGHRHLDLRRDPLLHLLGPTSADRISASRWRTRGWPLLRTGMGVM